jgi:hypothetical protein
VNLRTRSTSLAPAPIAPLNDHSQPQHSVCGITFPEAGATACDPGGGPIGGDRVSLRRRLREVGRPVVGPHVLGRLPLLPSPNGIEKFPTSPNVAKGRWNRAWLQNLKRHNKGHEEEPRQLSSEGCEGQAAGPSRAERIGAARPGASCDGIRPIGRAGSGAPPGSTFCTGTIPKPLRRRDGDAVSRLYPGSNA